MSARWHAHAWGACAAGWSVVGFYYPMAEVWVVAILCWLLSATTYYITEKEDE